MEHFASVTELLVMDHWTWAIIAVALVSIEILAPGIAFLWLGLAAGAMALLLIVIPGLSLGLQGVIYAVLAVVSVFLGRKILRRNPIATEDSLLNRRGAQYVGRVFTLENPLINGRGKIRVDDTTWVVEGPDLPAGTHVRVTAVEHVILRVERVEG
ncbi:NfeD family protein [Govanella unica]|uniref:NfeD family protein n=1 Tax=Govanella unica TaxID=2975056 RepID=A0A9X3TX84_9PROT|nr:NfeD family protein [Govania unica]MDA5193360.1 NfeD family protein [Govania unica]